MPAGEFISQLGPSSLPYEYFYQSLIVVCVCDHDFVDISGNRRLVRHWRVFVRDCGGLSCKGIIVGVRRYLLVDVHIAGINSFSHAREAIRLDDVILFVNLAVFQGGICEAIKSVGFWIMCQRTQLGRGEADARKWEWE